MKIKPFHKQNEFTMVHNDVIDAIMPHLSGSAWKVLTVIIRQTIGWHKEQDELSFNEIKRRAGITSDTTVAKAVQQLEKLGVILVDRPDLSGNNPNRYQQSNIYALNLDFEIDINPPATESPEEGEAAPPTPKNGEGVLQKMERGYSKKWSHKIKRV